MGKCENCFFYIPLDQFIGECRRYPPTTAVVENSSWDNLGHYNSAGWESTFPRSTPDEGCGEFREKLLG